MIAGALEAQSADVLWQTAPLTTGDAFVQDLAVAPNGDVIAVGNVPTRTSFAPGPAFTVGPAGLGPLQGYVIRYSADGTPLWVRSFVGGSDVTSSAVGVDASGRIAVVGSYRQGVDLDPSPGSVVNAPTYGASNMYFALLDSAGNFVAGRSLGIRGQGGIEANHVKTDGGGNFFISGTLKGTADLDWGPGVQTRSTRSPNTTAAFILKIDPSGNYLWDAVFDAFTSNFPDPDFAVDANSGDVALVTPISGIIDIDPSPGITNLTTPVPGTAAVIRLSNSGVLVWGGLLAQLENSPKCAFDPIGNIVVAGGFFPGDMDPGPGIVQYPRGFNVITLSPGGIFLSGASFPGSASHISLQTGGLTVDPQGDRILCFATKGWIDFDLGPGTATGSPNSMIVVRLDSNENLRWLQELPQMPSPAGIVGHVIEPVFDQQGIFVAYWDTYASAFIARVAEPSFQVQQPGGPGAPLLVSHTNLVTGGEYRTLLSIEPCPLPSLGTGPFLGLCATTPGALRFLSDQVSIPLGTPILRFTATGSSMNWAPVSVPPLVLDAVSFRFDAGSVIHGVSTVQRVTIL